MCIAPVKPGEVVISLAFGHGTGGVDCQVEIEDGLRR